MSGYTNWSEQELLNRRDRILSKGDNVSEGSLREINKIQNRLRDRYNYTKQNAPNLVKSNGRLVLDTRSGVTVGEQRGTADRRDVSTFRPYNPEAFDEAQRSKEWTDEQYAKLDAEQQKLAAESDAKLNAGEGTAKDVFGGQQSIELTEENKKSLFQRAKADIQNKEAKIYNELQKRRQAAQMLFSEFKPVASAIGGMTVYAQVGTQDLFTGTETEIGSNIKQISFVPFGKSITALPKPGKPELPPVQGFKAAVRAYKAYSENVKSKIITIKTGEESEYKPIPYDQYATHSRRFDVQAAVSVGNVINKYPAMQEKYWQQSPIGRAYIPAAMKISEASWSWATKKSANIPYVATAIKVGSDVFKPFVESSIKDPVLTYTTVKGPMVFGKFAYKWLDRADVAQSVVGGAITGYQMTGNVGGAIVGAGTGFVSEKGSDAFAGSFISSSPTTTFKVSPTLNTGETQSGRFKGIIYQTAADLPKGTKVEYSFLKADPLPKKSMNKVGVTTDVTMGSVTNRARFKTTRFVNTPQGPRRVETVKETIIRTPTSTPRTRVISQRMLPRTVGDMFRSKKGSLSLTGSMATTSPDYQGGLSNFQGTSETFKPVFQSTSQQKPKSRPLSRPKSRPTVRNLARPLSLQVTPSKSFGLGKSRFTYNTQSRFESQSVAMNPTQTQTQTFAINPTQSMTVVPTLSQTTTVSPTRTPTISQTRTQTTTFTPTLSQTITQTPTITPTFGKLPKFKSSNFASAFNTKKTGIKTKYTATAFAAGFNIKGKKLKGKLSGLEFRGV